MARRNKRSVMRDLTRHQVYLEQLKQGKVRDAGRAFDELGLRIARILQDLDLDTLDILTRRQLNTVLAQVREAHTDLLLNQVFNDAAGFAELAGHEAKWEAAFTNAYAKRGNPMKFVAAEAAYKRALANPVGEVGQMLANYAKGVSDSTLNKLNAAINKGWAQGKPIQDVVREIRGTRAGLYKDGVLSKAKRETETFVRTATQHISQQARMATWEKNSDLVERYTILATLDGRTSERCRYEDGKSYELGKGPVPPLHPGCRSTTIADLGSEFDFLDEGATRSSDGGYVDAEKDYYDWLKTEPRGKVEEVMGKTRAALFLDGGLSPDEFSKYGIDTKTFQPLTLAQMVERDSEPFRKAGINSWPGKNSPK